MANSMHQSYKLVLKVSKESNDITYHYNYNQVWRYIRSFPDPTRLLGAKVYFRSALADVFGGQKEELVYEGRALGY